MFNPCEERQKHYMYGHGHMGLCACFLSVFTIFYVCVHTCLQLFLPHPATVPGHMATMYSLLDVDWSCLLTVWVTPPLQVLWHHLVAL